MLEVAKFWKVGGDFVNTLQNRKAVHKDFLCLWHGRSVQAIVDYRKLNSIN